MKKSIVTLICLLLFALPRLARAQVVPLPAFDATQCWVTIAAPFTPKNIVTVTGAATLHYSYSCNPGVQVGGVQLAFGCADSLTANHSCPANYVQEFNSNGFGWYGPVADTGSIVYHSDQLPGLSSQPGLKLYDQPHDVNVWILGSNGHVIGAALDKSGNDLDAVIAGNNGNPIPGASTPVPTVQPTAQPTAVGCQADISVLQGATLTSPVTVTPVVSGCGAWPGATGFVRFEQTAPWPNHYDGNPGSNFVSVPLGNGGYSGYATLWSNLVTQIGSPSSQVNFTVGPSAPTPTPQPTVTPTPAPPTPTPAPPTPTPQPTACGFSMTTTQIIANCPVAAPAFNMISSPTPTVTPTGTPTPVVTPTPVPVAGVMRANDFLNTLGVTSHVVQSLDTPAQWQSAMAYLGIRHNRDDFTLDIFDPRHLISTFFCAMHSSMGVTFVGRSNAGDSTDTFAGWDALAQCGALMSVEGANEPNNFPFSYNGQSCNWQPGADGSGCGPWQKTLFTGAKADANLVGIPVFSATEVGAMTTPNDGEQFISGYADYANLHNYVWPNNKSLTDNAAWNAEDPDHSINSVDGMDGEFINKTWRNGYLASPIGSGQPMPKVTTETGWPSGAGLSEDLRGKLLVSVLLDGAARNWSWTFLYQLLDDSGDSFGLFTNANPPVPKLAATYIHNLIAILADNSSNFTPVPISCSCSPMPATVHTLLLQKSNGTYEYVVWDEAFLSQTGSMVTVGFGGSHSGSVYDVTIGTTPVSTFGPGASVPLTLSDHPMVVEFK